MTSPPRVSVVLPVWNGEQFLANAIESVLAQTLDALELLVVDDGSTDGSADLAGDFARRDPRVQVLRLPRAGIARALNAGIARARAPYVARMDADDVCDPARLEKQVAHLDANADVVAVGSAIEVIDATGEHVGTRTFPERHEDIAHRLLHAWSTAIAHPTVVARREALEAVGGYRRAFVPSEDLDLWMRLSRIGKLANLPEPLLRYRRHADTVALRERERQWAVMAAIVNGARRRHGLRPLAAPPLRPLRSRVAAYHFECARTALLTGPRRAAIRHARATIAHDPSWPHPYAALLACAFPKWTLRLVLGLSAPFRLPRFYDR